MFLKNFYLNYSKTSKEIIDKKFCSENIYGKFLIRSGILINKKLLFIDNGKSFFHIKKETVKNSLNFSSKDSFVGSSLRVKNNVFINQQNKLIKFKYFSFYKNNNSNPFLKLKNILYKLKEKKTIPLILLRTIKGGFFCYLMGIVCFVPKRQVNNCFITKQKDLFNFKTVLSILNRKENAIYLPFYLSKLNLSIYYDKKFRHGNPKRKLYLLNFMASHSKKLLKNKTKRSKILRSVKTNLIRKKK